MADQLNYQMIKECRALGTSLQNAHPIDALKNVSKLFHMYGEQQLTLDDAAAYIFIVADAMFPAETGRMGGRWKL